MPDYRARPYRPTPGHVALATAAVLLILGYPVLVAWAIERVGVRAVALVLAAVAATGVARGGGRLTAALGTHVRGHLGFIALAVAAAVTGARVFLLFVPALVHLVLLDIFAASLRGPGSIIERAARVMEPRAPEFIRSYCRKVTIAWCAFFVANAILITALALAAPTTWWPAYTGWIVYAVMGVLVAIEFLVRKWWFRYYYYGGPFDRVWSTLFPAENTPQGRRSAAYVRQVREEMRRQGIER